MKLNSGDDSHNVYVLYSDLLFNLLILFLILVLALVIRMHGTMEAVQHGRPGSEAQDKTIAALTERATAAEARAVVLQHLHDNDMTTVASLADQVTAAYQKQAAAEAKADAAQARVNAAEESIAGEQKSLAAAMQQQLAIAAGANRFTGRSGESQMCVAVDLSRSEPRYVLVNATAFDSAGSTLDGESSDEHKLRAAKVLHAAIDNAPRFSLGELHDLFRGLSVKVDDESQEGTLLFSFGGQATFIASGWEDNAGDVNEGSVAPQYTEMMNDGSFSTYHSELIHKLLTLRDSLHRPEVPETVPVLHFSQSSDHEHLRVGNRDYTLDEFRHILSSFGEGGIILQYDPQGNELCPDWVIRDVLTETGYVNSVPDPAKLAALRSQLQRP
jgi:hypothetical protein